MKEGDPLALQCVAALTSSTTASVARHRPTAGSPSTTEPGVFWLALPEPQRGLLLPLLGYTPVFLLQLLGLDVLQV